MLPTSSENSYVVPSRVCELCGIPLVGNLNGRPIKRFCSSSCYQRNRRGLPPLLKERACDICGKVFPVLTSKKFVCSKKCKEKKRAQKPVRRESQRKHAKTYYLKHKDKIKKANREWISSHMDRMRELQKAFRLKDMDMTRQRGRLYAIRRRARNRGAQGSHTIDEFKSICKKQGNRCAHCNKKCKLTIDHVMPLVAGGTNYAFNLQGLCLPCNIAKGAKILLYAHPSLFDKRVPV
jgi:hypothetical protein